MPNTDPLHLAETYAKQAANRTPQFVSAAEFLTEETRIDYLVKGIIEQDTTGQLFGPSGCGKTFIALDLAGCVVTGEPALHGRNMCRRGIVLYLAGEGFGGIRRRVKAWAQHRGATPEDLKLLCVSKQTIDIYGDGLTEAIAAGRAMEEHHGQQAALIVIDTLARHLDGNENDTKDMSRFINAVDCLRTAFPGSVALIVHHTGHGEDTRGRSRGSSALRGAMDFEIQCDKGLLTFTKMKDGELPDPIAFKLSSLEIGLDNDGQPVTSCVVEWGERSERHQAAEMTFMERLAVQCLIETSAQAGEQRDGKWSALVGDWRATFYKKRRTEDPDIKTNTVKNAFLTTARSLIEKKIICDDGEYRTLNSETHQNEIITIMALPQPSGVRQASFPVISDGVQQPSGVISPYKGDDTLTPVLTADDSSDNMTQGAA